MAFRVNRTVFAKVFPPYGKAYRTRPTSQAFERCLVAIAKITLAPAGEGPSGCNWDTQPAHRPSFVYRPSPV